MAISQRLDLRQTQNLVMTPQLQQAIKLLQLSSVELAEYVETELEQNPLLERGDEGSERVADPDAGLPDDAEPSSPDSFEHLSIEQGEIGEGALDADYGNDFDYDIAGPGAVGDASAVSDYGGGESFSLGSDVGGSDARRAFEDGDYDPFAGISEEKTLSEHLHEQVILDIPDPAERMIAANLIGALDEAGWLAEDPQDIAERLGCGVEVVEAVLAKMKRFDPAGVFARDLKECLALQLADLNRLDPAMQALLDNLPLLADGQKARLLRICKVDEEDLREMVAEIRALNPKPALAFLHEPDSPVVPDVIVRRGPSGDWIVELNPDTQPKLLVNDQYYAQVSKHIKDKTEKDYLTERHQTANWLVRSLHQRATTILRVSSEIVRQQDAFLRHGISHLRPLVLRDIADAIEMHESTISRVTTNKYMATPRGLFELKYFFTSSIASTGAGDAHSAEAVRHRIRQLIDAEEPKAILSDDRIVELLQEDGIDIARRTVAKYREAMNIPSSVQRRRQKQRGL